MDQDQTKNVATETEIPVAPPEKPKVNFNFSSLPPTKILLVIAGIVLIVVIGIFLYFSMIGKKVPLQTAQDIKVAYESGNLSKTEQLTKEALELNDDPALQAFMIDVIMLQGNQSGKEKEALKKAEPYIDAALKKSPNNIDVLLAVGYSYEAAGEYEKALEYYEKALKIDSKSSDALFHKAHVLQFLNKNDEANKIYTQSSSIDPNNPLTLMAQANSYYAVNDLQKAFETFKKAAEVAKDNQTKAEALTGAAVVRRNQDNFKHIFESYTLSKQAYELSPTFSPALGAYGFNLALTGEQEEGIGFLKQAIEANPRITKNYYQLSLVYRVRKNYSDAINYNKDAISRVPDDNTLLGKADKDFSKGQYLYDLAKTYLISGLDVDTMPILVEAVSLNSTIVEQLKLDVANVNFAKLTNNPDFVKLIQ